MKEKAFILTFLKRDLFSVKAYSWQVVLSIFIGVGAITSILSYKLNFADLIQKEAKNLMGADLAFQTPEKIRPFQRKLLQDTLPKGTKTAEVVSFLSMIQTKESEESALSLVKAVDKEYPLYSSIDSNPENAYKNLNLDEVLLDESLALNLKLKIGDKVQLGNKLFTYRGIILKEPGSLGNFIGMAPSSIILKDSLIGSGLEEKGSRIRYTIYAKFPENQDAYKFKIQYFNQYSENDLTIFHNTETSSGSQLFITNTLDFLSILGLGALFIGSIAIFIASKAKLNYSISQYAILKCLGLRNYQLRILIFSEIVFLAILGSLLGIGLAYELQTWIPDFTEEFGIHLKSSLNKIAIFQGLFIGITIPLLVTLHSIIESSTISPMMALKNPEGLALETENLNKKIQLKDWFIPGILFLAFVGIVYLDTQSLAKTFILSILFFVIPILIWFIYLFIRLMVIFLSHKIELPREVSIVLKKIIRQYGFITLSIIGLGSAIFILLLSLLLRESLLTLGGARALSIRPNVFVLDIRNEQKEEFEKIIYQFKAKEFRVAPVFRARLDKINGKKIEKTNPKIDARERDWRSQARTREYLLSYRYDLYDTEKVTSGKFWKVDAVDEISIEKDFAKYLPAKVGDELEFKLEGYINNSLKGKVTNLRYVNWSDMKPNFVVIFSGGTLSQLPGYYLSSFYIEKEMDRYELQKLLTKKFPNITFIDTEKAVRSFEGIIDKVSIIINIMSSLLVVAAILLLISVLYSTSRERMRELVFFRIIGARKPFIYKLIFWEAIAMGFISFGAGLILAYITDLVLNYFILDLESVYPILSFIIVFFSTCLGILIAYFMISFKLFSQPVKKLIKV